MDRINLLDKIFRNCNDNIFRLDKLPWEEENKIINNIITCSKRRINVKGFQQLIKLEELNHSELAIYESLINEGFLIVVKSPENYLVITEIGILYLNYYFLNGISEHHSVLNLSKEMLVKISTQALQRRCEGVFSVDISNQEAILAIFLLLNGSISYSSGFQLHMDSKGGYLYGKEIIGEINSIYRKITDQELLIKDEKEFRNVIGRNGKNGRLAKAFPNIFQREENKIWFDIVSHENKLLTLKNILTDLIIVLGKEDSFGKIINSFMSILERYMVNNPLEPYIIKQLFSTSTNFEHLVNLHIVAKDLQSSN